MAMPELTTRTYILGGSLLGVLMLFFFVRQARAKEKALEAPGKAPAVKPPAVKPTPKPPTQQQLAYRAPGSGPSLDIRRPAPVTMPRPPRPRGPGKAWRKAQAEFQKFKEIEALSPKERAKARREAMVAQGIKPGSVVPGPMNLPPPWACPQGYGWIHNQKKFPHGRWSCKQGVVTQRPKPKTPAELKADREARKAQRATA